jgi:hypothetical protein
MKNSCKEMFVFLFLTTPVACSVSVFVTSYALTSSYEKTLKCAGYTGLFTGILFFMGLVAYLIYSYYSSPPCIMTADYLNISEKGAIPEIVSNKVITLNAVFDYPVYVDGAPLSISFSSENKELEALLNSALKEGRITAEYSVPKVAPSEEVPVKVTFSAGLLKEVRNRKLTGIPFVVKANIGNLKDAGARYQFC